jgi:hypothetical protein
MNKPARLNEVIDGMESQTNGQKPAGRSFMVVYRLKTESKK